MNEQEKRARDLVRRVLKGGKRSISSAGGHQKFRQELERKDIGFVLEIARAGDKGALEILREYARGARRTGMIVPADLHTFVWEFFIDGPPKAPPGPKPQATTLRNPIIVQLIKALNKDFGLPEYRSPDRRDTKTGPFSACAIVAQEIGLSERRVEEIWDEGKTRLKA